MDFELQLPFTWFIVMSHSSAHNHLHLKTLCSWTQTFTCCSLSHLCHNISIRHIEMVNVKFSVKRQHMTGINESHWATGHGESQKKQDALTSFLWELYGWNEESADEGGQASSQSPLPLPPLPPRLSNLIIGDHMNDKNHSIHYMPLRPIMRLGIKGRMTYW